MAILADFFIYTVASVVDLVSYILFQILAALMLAVYHVLKIPTFILVKLLRMFLLGVPYVLDTLVNIIANIILSSISGLVSLFYATLRGFINILLTIAFDLLGHLQTAVTEFAALMVGFVMNVGKLTGLSVYNIWKNFNEAVYEFISNM